MICDVAKWQGKIDWDKLGPAIEDGYVAIKASGKYANGADPQYARNVEGAVAHGVPFHAFHFLYCLTEAEARRDAGLFFRTVQAAGRWPLFWVLDLEGAWGVKDADAPRIAAAFEGELRRLARENGPGEIRVALYVAQQKYHAWALDYDHYAYIWIPGYGEKYRPKMPCDVWQYTDKGRLPGISVDVDLNMLIGDKPMGFFTGKEDNNMATVYVYGASIDENGKARGGKAGNQTGRELRKQAWYKHSKGWRVFRAKNQEVAAKIAQDAKWAVANMNIGYDQGQRNTLYTAAKPHGFNCKAVAVKCECDCSALVRVCCAYAGITGLPADFRTTNEPALLLKTGAFEEMTGAAYTDRADYLKAGDILCTRTQGHTVIVGNNGSKAGQTPSEGLRRGDYGTAVTAMQKLLLKWDKACLPKCGADGDFGGETERAVKDFQNTHDLPVTGVYDEKTRELLTGMYGEPGTEPPTPEPTVQQVEITGGTVNVRSAPGTKGKDIGDVHRGERYPYGGLTAEVDGRDWYLIDWHNTNGWVSSKFARLV